MYLLRLLAKYSDCLVASLMPFIVVSFFCLFRNINILYSRRINTVASCTFGIYLFHASSVTNMLFWQAIAKMPQHYPHRRFIIVSFIACIVIFVSGVIVDLSRQKLFAYISAHRSKTIDLSNK